ncbi:MAG: glycosyltransferase family 2 protein [Candidatus Brocadia sp.]|jgi:glycosyltransferase involved in cell wall biosynthesis
MNANISVIIPTRNRKVLLERAIKSVQKQTFQDWEIIVVDDASTDDTMQLLAQFQTKDDRIKVIRHEKAKGGAAARNSGIAACHGEWVAFLDDDDFWLSQKLELQLNLLRQYEDAVACTCAFVVHRPLRRDRIITPPVEVSLEQLIRAKTNIMGGMSVCMCSFEGLQKIGGFDERLSSAQDWDLWIRLRQAGKIVCYHDKALVHYDSYFSNRITSNMQAKYSGHRRFYFKYRHLMDKHRRQSCIAELCYFRSSQTHRGIWSRVKNFRMSIRYATPRLKIYYIKTSFLNIISFLFKMLFKPGFSGSK